MTAHAIDEEVRRIIDTNYSRAKKLLDDNIDKLHTMAKALDEVRDYRRDSDQGHHGRS